MPTVAKDFYPSTTDHDGSFGVDVRKLVETQQGDNNSATLTYGTTADQDLTRTVDPYTASGFSGNGRADYGWAINFAGVDGADSVSTARRVIPAGVWTFRATLNIPQAGSATGTITAYIRPEVFRVSPAGVRTSLFGFQSATQSQGALSGAADFVFTAASPSQPEFILAAGETIHVGWSVVSRQTAGLLGATVTNTQIFRVGGSFCFFQMPSAIRTIYSSGTHVGIGVAVVSRTLRVGVNRLVVGVGLVALLRLIGLRFPAPAAGVVALAKIISPKPFAVAGIGVVTVVKRIYKAFLVTGTAIPSTTKKMFVSTKVVGTVVAIFNRSLVASRAFVVIGTATALFSRAIIAVRSFAVQAVGLARLDLKIPQSALNRLGGGAVTVVRKVINFIFDD